MVLPLSYSLSSSHILEHKTNDDQGLEESLVPDLDTLTNRKNLGQSVLQVDLLDLRMYRMLLLKSATLNSEKKNSPSMLSIPSREKIKKEISRL